MLSRIAFSLLVYLMVALCSCSSANDQAVDVVVSILPQKYIVKQIGGEKVNVEAFVRPGESPETYQPTPRQMMQAGEAAVYFTVGVPFEKRFVPRIKSSFPRMIIVDMALDIDRQAMHKTESETAGHDHGHDHEDGFDPHVWLSPLHLKTMAQNTCSTLVEIDPQNSKLYRENLASFQARSDSLHHILESKLSPFKGRTVYVYHPAFGYFLREYGMKQKAVEVGGKSPSPQQLVDLIKSARQENVAVIFVQPQFDPSSAKAIANAIDGKVVTMDPLEYNVLENLDRMAEQIESALK